METKAAFKRENGIDFPARDFAYVPDPGRPSTWKLRLTESPGNVTVEQLGRAAAALSPGGFRGNRVDLPPSAVSSVKRRIRAEYRKLGVGEDKIPNSVKQISQIDDLALGQEIAFWKDINGDTRWLAVYSNKFRDSDHPPEIISDKSHRNFVKMVDDGVVDYPELWLWHLPVAWGKADMVDYIEGFAIASGYIYGDDQSQRIAENMQKAKNQLVSHGMPYDYLGRDVNDSSIIVKHVTREISPLPASRAANKITGFAVLKGEMEMGFSDEKRQYLLQMGVSKDYVDKIEGTLKDLNSLLSDAGIESKEVLESKASDSMPENEGEEEEESKETGEETDTGLSLEVGDVGIFTDGKEITYVTKEEVAETLGEVVKSMTEGISELRESINEVKKEVAELKKSDAEKVADLKESTPTASQFSLSDLVKQRVIGDPNAAVDGRTTLGKDAPKETEAPQGSGPLSGSSLLNGIMNNGRA